MRIEEMELKNAKYEMQNPKWWVVGDFRVLSELTAGSKSLESRGYRSVTLEMPSKVTAAVGLVVLEGIS